MSRVPDLRIDNRWINSHRGAKERVNPFIPGGFFNEQEFMGRGVTEEVTTILITNRECPYRCLMCDLWIHTTGEPVPQGAIPAQIEYALSRLPATQHVKLYNSGSFFDRSAIPVEDHRKIAQLVSHFKTVTVESHTALLGQDCLDFTELLKPELVVAVGLETIHPEVLPRLNKKMTVDDFRNAVSFLNSHGISSRAFILLRPPFLSEEEGVEWAIKSLDYAFGTGVETCSVIPVRAGNGAMEVLGEAGYFSEPAIQSLERVLEYGIRLGKGRVFADLWDLERFSTCHHCFTPRKERLQRMNLRQQVVPEINCSCPF